MAHVAGSKAKSMSITARVHGCFISGETFPKDTESNSTASMEIVSTTSMSA